MRLDRPAPPTEHGVPDGGKAAPTEESVASGRLGSKAPEPAVPAPELPEIAKNADDLEAIKKAVDDAAAIGGGLWLSYLFVLFYLAVAAGAVTHADLFFEKPVKLPFLGIELPLVAFFSLAPLIFLVVHAYTLVHLVMLTDKARRYHQALYDQIGDKPGLSQKDLNERKAKRDGLRRQLPSNIFIQFLAGPSDLRESGFGRLLRAIAWITLAIAPVLLLLLLMMQIQFLPYHSSFVIWTQRAALGLDLALIWWLWRKILSGREIDGGRNLGSRIWSALGFALSLAVLLLSLTVVTFPGEWQEDRLPSWRFLPALDEWGNPPLSPDPFFPGATESFREWVTIARRVSLHDWLSIAQSDQTTRRRLPFSATLVLPGLNVYEELGIDDPEKIKGRDYVFRARGRDLKGAIFDFASLPKVDFTGAHLERASLDLVQVDGASLSNAQLQGAKLFGAHLQGAKLDGAELQNASLFGAHLQGASLLGAHLQGARLDNAQLQGASLRLAWLQHASLRDAQLQGASLKEAQLQSANPDGTQLQGASLEMAKLQGASLKNAQLQGASLDRSGFQHVQLDEAELAPVLKEFVCSGGDAAYVLRGLLNNDRLAADGPEAPALIDFIMSKDCPVFGSLTEADKAMLVNIRERTLKHTEKAK